MDTGAWRVRTSISVVFCSLVLGFVLTDVRPAMAQETCPLPAGATPPADPPVTAQDVEDGSASLEDFALAARAQFKSVGSDTLTSQQIAFSGCRLRLEGGPWRSGSTYIVTLTPDGRVFLHTKDMSLSAGSVHPSIYAGILSALGVPRTVLEDLRSPDPATSSGAQSMLLSLLSREPHAPFDLTNPVPGVRPGIRGASGYAAAYVSVNSERPILLLAGFDLTASHLVGETVDYGNPTVTARDVVDRGTLKAFVTEALRFLVETQTNARTTAESRVAFAKARLALRDPNGPWRHGSVYLYILDRTSNVILFHGAFPDRFELKPLVPTVRDAVTGELVLPQVIAAAGSGPEGGFVEYFWDDPSDDTDRADIPKVGYAREFKRTITTGDGSEIHTNLVIGSGFYRSPSEVAAEDRDTVVESVLPQVMRAMTASTVDAISGRIQRATSDAPPEKQISLGGASTLSHALLTHGQALGNGTLDLGPLLAGSSFTMPLNIAGSGGSGPTGEITLWGSGDYRNLSGGSSQSVSYDGDVVSAVIGADTWMSPVMMAGAALSQSQGTVDYTDADGQSGELSTTLTSVNPYAVWGSPGGMNLWLAAGYGWGEIEIEESAGTQTSDMTQKMGAVGATGPLMASDEVIEGGTTNLRLKGEMAFTWADVDGSGTLESTKLAASRQRVTLEGVHDRELASGAIFSPSLEVGMRSDGGDGETGTGLEAGGGLRYTDPALGLTLEGRARTLLSHGDDYEESGVSGLVRIDAGTAGLGLALSVRPAWGRTASGVQRLWETGTTGGTEPASEAAGRLNARVAYGIGTGWGDQGVLTPYTDVSLSGAGSRRLSLGGRIDMGPSVHVSLEGTHSRLVRGTTDHSIILRGALNW